VVGRETTTLNLKLASVKTNETVQVSSASSMLQTESSTLGRAVDQQTIENLPLANRNYIC
jgi:hypothetical protein